MPKPRVLNVGEWNTEHEGEAYWVRAEVMTLLDGRPCSPTPVLHDPLELLAPDLAVVDREGWGVAPAGFDAAVLLCHSLLVSKIAAEVHGRFSGVLDTTDGLKCQLYVVAWMPHRIEHGDDPAIAGPLHRHAETVQARLEG